MKRRELVGRMAALASGGLLVNSASAQGGHTDITAGSGEGNQPVAGSKGGAGNSSTQSYGPVFDVKKYGAKGDGKTNDRLAIQKAIDACAKAGGGTVLLEKGVFMSGGIKMKSHVELHLSSNAVLMGVTEMNEYNHDTNFPQGGGIRSLINAEGCEHIAITGRGKIDGQGHLFTHTRGYSFRPYLVYFRRCRNIHISDIQLYNSAVWVCWLLQCERVKIDGMKADNPVSPNRDGIDIDGCKDVTISNCIFKTEDDSIAFKVSEKGYPTRDVVVTNCIISSRCAAIRFGPDAIDNIENVTISNCVITDTRLNGIKIQESMGAVMRNLTFSNIVMDNVRGPISLRVAGWLLKADEPAPFEINDTAWEQGNLQNILFNNIQGVIPKDNICMSITGTSKTRPQQITFSNIDFTFSGGGTAEQGARREVPDLDRNYL